MQEVADGQLKEQMTADMRRANYADETVYRYVSECERFARHSMRSPAEMGKAEIKAYLDTFVDRRWISAYRSGDSSRAASSTLPNASALSVRVSRVRPGRRRGGLTRTIGSATPCSAQMSRTNCVNTRHQPRSVSRPSA